MSPPTGISGWTLQFDLMKRFGTTTPVISRYCASGYNNSSGINVIDGMQGIFSVDLHPSDVSGIDPSNLAYQVRRTDSGSATGISEGFRIMLR